MHFGLVNCALCFYKLHLSLVCRAIAFRRNLQVPASSMFFSGLVTFPWEYTVASCLPATVGRSRALRAYHACPGSWDTFLSHNHTDELNVSDALPCT